MTTLPMTPSITTAELVAVPPAMSLRRNFIFSANARYGVCLRATDTGLSLERWILTAAQARCRTIPEVAVDRETHALPLDDGRILIDRAERSTSYRRELVLLQPTAGRVDLTSLGAIPVLLGGSLLASPNSDQLGFMVTLDDLDHSMIWRFLDSAGSAEPVMRVPGLLSGGVWLDPAALVLGINQSCAGAPSSGITVDLRQGSWKRIWSVSETSSDQILLCDPDSRLMIVSTTVSGGHRLGWARLGEPSVHFPDTLYRPGYVRQALTLDDRGEQLLVREVAGATSRLLRYTPADDHLAALAVPPGTISPPATWVGDVIRFRFSAPGQPPTLATVRLATEPRWSVNRDDEPGRPADQPQAELTELDGPAGPIEAIVYGGPDWRQREHLVVALHGGPLSCWRLEFDPLFQLLSAHGVAVVAPNYRGSTGYGEEHLRAVVGRWGGPDLDDILALGRDLEQDRASRHLPRPVVLGMSYGAFLALLAACHEPHLWSACVALAPFLSGPRFHECADATVRRRIAQLGGLRPIGDTTGPRDVLAACASLAAPLLLMHGSKDETIPVAQSRLLRQRLLELGRTEGVDFDYAEVDSDHTELVHSQRGELNQRVVRFCRLRSGSDSNRHTGSTRQIGGFGGRCPLEPLPAVSGSGTS